MKKILLLLLLFPLISFAKFFEGSITLKDGTVKAGMVEVPKHSRADKIKFKGDKKGKVQTLEIKNVSEFSITNDDGKKFKYITLKLSNPKPFTKKYKTEEEISWVRLDYEDNISFVVAFIAAPLSMEAGEPVYYLHKKGEDFCSYITVFYDWNMVQIGQFGEIRTVCEIVFKEDCPQLSEKLTKAAFKEKSLLAVSDLYNELCGK